MELKVTANTTQVNKIVDKVIGDRLAVIIEKELGSFVEGHLAKKKLTGRSPPDMCALIDKRLEKIVREAINLQMTKIRQMPEWRLQDRIDDAINKRVDAHFRSKKAAVKKALVDGS